jgi:drug/metabolite transporter (DMT)-like permease
VTAVVVVGASLGAAAFYAVATTLKHRSAGHAPDAQDFKPGQLARFIRATLTHRLWLAGIAADTGGLALQVSALYLGALAVVQPLLVSGLLFALLLSHLAAHTRISRQELASGLLLTLSLAAFLLISGAPSASSRHDIQGADHGPAITAGILAVALAVILVVLARRLPHGPSAALLGTVVGICYAATAALLKSCTNIAGRGPSILFTSWQLYVLLAIGGAGLLLNQLAFQAGPLTASLPAITTVDPVLSVAIGVWIYDERLRHSAIGVLGEVICLGVLCFATINLSRISARVVTVEQSADRK